jgi:hypothetical protein
MLSTELVSPSTRRRAYGALLVSALVFAALVPFARHPLAPVPGFIPVYQSALIVGDLVTAVLLFGHYRLDRSLGIGLLAAGYLMSAAMAAVHLLSFPDLFAPGGWLPAGPQSTAWLYMFWHAGFPCFVIAYTLVGARLAPPGHRGATLALLAVGAAVAGLASLATLGHDLLPPIMAGNRYTPAMKLVVGSFWACSLVAAMLLWRRRGRSVLDLWLLVVMCAWLFDIGLAAVFNAGRYDLGFYAGRAYGLLAASYVLTELLLADLRLHRLLVRMHGEEQARASELAAARDAARAADETKGRFLANMSHEVRTR